MMGAPPPRGAPPGQPLMGQPQPVPFMGMQVDAAPKAAVQRRVYAADERMPEQPPTG